MSDRVPVIAGNWKMNPAPGDFSALISDLRASIASIEGVERVVCPPFVYLGSTRDLLLGCDIGVGAQDCFWHDYGAYTGEISAAMLSALAIGYVIIGHSERRQYFGETDETVKLKTEAAIEKDLKPIVCVGETLAQREAGETEAVLTMQISGGLRGVKLPQGAIVAYEPVWAIGTGQAASPEQANEACGMIRGLIAQDHGEDIAASLRILYGGSVNAANAGSFLSTPEVDGALVGGASLKASDFAEIVKAALP